MKIAVINGSPKGDYSITLQTVHYLERKYRDLQKHNSTLLEMVEDYHEELTGECIEGEELLKRKLKSQKSKSKQIGR